MEYKSPEMNEVVVTMGQIVCSSPVEAENESFVENWEYDMF